MGFVPSTSSAKSSALTVTISVTNGSAISLPFAGTSVGVVSVSVSWGGCVAGANFPSNGNALLTSQYANSMLSLSVSQYGGVSLAINNDFLTLVTNGHASCYGGYPFFGAQTGSLVVNKTNAAFVIQPGVTTLYADYFGFEDLQVYNSSLSAGTLTGLFNQVYGAAGSNVLPSPPPAAASGLAADAYSACAGASLVHRYANSAASFLAVPGMLADTAGSWNAARVDAAGAAMPGASAATGTLLVAVPAGPDGATPANDLGAASGVTVRVLFDSPAGGVVPSFDWQGFSVFNTSAGSTAVANTYSGTSSSYTGPGTVTHPAVPYINGLYTTFSMGAAGTLVYVGPYLWASFPAVYFAAGQGAMNAANRITLYNANLYDFQVYSTALTAAQIIGLSEGVSLSNC